MAHNNEFGLFNDEGCVEAGFYSREAAEAARLERYEPDDALEIHVVCQDHENEPEEFCQECQQTPLPCDEE